MALRARRSEGPRPTTTHNLRCNNLYRYVVRTRNGCDDNPTRPARPTVQLGCILRVISFSSSLSCPGLTSLQNRPIQIAEEGPSIGTHHNNMGAPSFVCAGGHVAQTCNAKQHPRRIRGRLPRLVSPTCHLRRLSSWPWPRPPARQTRTPPLSRMTFPSASRKTRSTSRSTDSGARCR